MNIPAIARLRETWSRLNARERRILQVGGVLLLLAIMYSLYDWQAKLHKQLDVSIPRATAQLAVMQGEAAELARLRGLPAAEATDLTQLATSLQSGATARNLAMTVRSDGNQLVATGKAINFDLWVQWLAEAQRNTKVHLNYLDILQAPGGPTLEARLMPPTR